MLPSYPIENPTNSMLYRSLWDSLPFKFLLTLIFFSRGQVKFFSVTVILLGDLSFSLLTCTHKSISNSGHNKSTVQDLGKEDTGKRIKQEKKLI